MKKKVVKSLLKLDKSIAVNFDFLIWTFYRDISLITLAFARPVAE